jgi:hypothetical protein
MATAAVAQSGANEFSTLIRWCVSYYDSLANELQRQGRDRMAEVERTSARVCRLLATQENTQTYLLSALEGLDQKVAEVLEFELKDINRTVRFWAQDEKQPVRQPDALTIEKDSLDDLEGARVPERIRDLLKMLNGFILPGKVV